MVLVSCSMVLAADTWTVMVCIPSLGKVYEILPSNVITGCRYKMETLSGGGFGGILIE